MASDNTLLNVGTGGNTVRTLNEATTNIEWPAGVDSYVTGGSAGAWTLQCVDITHGLPVQPMTGATWAATQSGAWNITNITGTVSLPTGAATAAKQPALGTAGAASTDVITVQGIASMTPLLVTLSGSNSLAANQSVNVSQINGVAPSMGSGVTGTGVQRVTLATDVALPAGTNVLGQVGQNGTWTVQPGNTANTTPWIFKLHDGTNPMAAFFDLDTGAGTQYLPGFNVRISGSGGSIEAKGQQTMANSLPVVIASDQGSFTLAATQSGAWTVTSLTQFNGNAIDTNSGNKSAGTLRVVLATDQPQLTNKLLVTPDAGATVQPIAGTSGGATPYNLISAATTNATSVKASAGQVYGIQAMNLNASPRYLKLYDKASAPTVGTDTPVKVLMLPGNTAGAGAILNIPAGIVFSLGIAFALTTGITNADTGAVAASEITVNIDYK